MSRRGFTFIEMLTVWGIIMILAAMLFPVFAKARAKAYQTNCLRNQHNIGIALKAYAQDHYGHFPPNDNDLSPLVPECLPDPEALLCPTIGIEGPPGRRTDFVYRGGLCDDDRPNTLIVADDDTPRHNDGANYLFLDGHAKWMRRLLEGEREEMRRFIEGSEEISRLQQAAHPAQRERDQ